VISLILAASVVLAAPTPTATPYNYLNPPWPTATIPAILMEDKQMLGVMKVTRANALRLTDAERLLFDIWIWWEIYPKEKDQRVCNEIEGHLTQAWGAEWEKSKREARDEIKKVIAARKKK
jgi:hypothetical protein